MTKQTQRVENWTFGSLDMTVAILNEREYGSADEERLEQLRDDLREVVEQLSTSRLVLDLTNVEYYGAGFLGVLAQISRLLHLDRKQLLICGDRWDLVRQSWGSFVAASYPSVEAAIPLC